MISIVPVQCRRYDKCMISFLIKSECCFICICSFSLKTEFFSFMYFKCFAEQELLEWWCKQYFWKVTAFPLASYTDLHEYSKQTSTLSTFSISFRIYWKFALLVNCWWIFNMKLAVRKLFWLARANLVFVIPASSPAFLTRSNAIYYKYLINLSCLVRTVSYGSSFFPSNYGLCALHLGHNMRWKILVHNLRYWPRAQLIGYIYRPVHHQQWNTEASKLCFCRAIIGLYNWVAPGKNRIIATSSEIFKYVRIHKLRKLTFVMWKDKQKLGLLTPRHLRILMCVNSSRQTKRDEKGRPCSHSSSISSAFSNSPTVRNLLYTKLQFNISRSRSHHAA